MDFRPPVGKQLESINLATRRINLWEGSVRSSKTISSLVAWIAYVMTGPPGNLLMVGKTERTLKRNILDVLAELLPRGAFRHVAGSAGECFIFGRRIYIAGANDERAGDRIRGMTLAGAYVDEASVIPESFWTMLLSRLSEPGARCFATTNPESPQHWLKLKYLDRAGLWLTHDSNVEQAADALDMARFSFRLADNPALSPAYVAALRMEYTGLWSKRLIDGLWVLAEGSIFDSFDSEVGGRHVVATLPEMDRFWLGIDYGTTNPFVALLLGLGVDDCIYVVREWRWDSHAKRRQLTDAEYSTNLRKWLVDLGRERLAESWGESLEGMLDRVYVDPSAASFAVQMYRDGWHGVHHADNAVGDGIRAVNTLLNAGRLKVHESCSGLIAETTGYVWDSRAQAMGEDKPIKVDDHGPDAMRYGVWSQRRLWLPWTTAPAADPYEVAA